MLCKTTVKLGGYKEEEIITLPASYRSYYDNLIDLVEEIHLGLVGLEYKRFLP